MNRKSFRMFMIGLLAVALAAPGCETAGGSAATGAVVGGLIGGVIGNQSGHAVEGAAIGAAVGGLAGWGIHKYRTRQARTAQETYQDYQYEPDQGFKLEMKEGRVSPATVAPGQAVTVTTEYATMGAPAEGVPVHEMRSLTKDGEVLRVVQDETVRREDGTWEWYWDVDVPEGAEVGEYAVAQQISAEGQSFQRDFEFTVRQANAAADAEQRYEVAVVSVSDWRRVE